MNTQMEAIFRQRKLKPTAVRILILNFFLENSKAWSLQEIEDALDTVDKSTVFRNLQIFKNKGILHSISDGTKKVKYALCSLDCDCTINDQHFHFHCENCGDTFCLNKLSLPELKLPPKVKVTSANLVLNGICEKCNT